MNRFFAAWQDFQDAVVRHPLCRYTILPAGIVLAIWLVALPLALGAWAKAGDVSAYELVDILSDLSKQRLGLLVLMSIGVVAGMLTGRLLPVLTGFLVVFLAVDIYPHAANIFTSTASTKTFFLCRLAFFVPAWLWLLSLDWRQAKLPALLSWMKWLAGASVMFLGIFLLVSAKAENDWLRAGLLLPLATAFGFTVFFDLAWRVSKDQSVFSSRLLSWVIVFIGWLLMGLYFLFSATMKIIII
jgi:hypothetical protein